VAVEATTAANEDHIGGHVEIRDLIATLQKYAVRLAQEEQDAGLINPQDSHAPCSQNIIDMVHGDAKSACSAAKLAQEQTGPGQNLGVHVDAIAELNAQTATIYVNAHGVGAKDGNQIANQRLFYINAKSNGARVLIIINDCCASKNYIGINSAGLPAFLVLSGLYDLVITIILGIIHSKGMCDRLFGSGTVMLADLNWVNEDSLLRHWENVPDGPFPLPPSHFSK